MGLGSGENPKFCEVCVISRTVYTMATDLSQGKMQEFVGQRLKRNNISISKSVFKGMF